MPSPDQQSGPSHQPAIYLPHGGGPCFFMDWPPGQDPWASMGGYLRGVMASLPAPPRAILVISAHWEAAEFTVNTGAAPALLYDYHGFPEHTYHLDYPAPGAPDLARRVTTLLAAAGLASGEEGDRGYDHGVFVPFLLIDPTASIPVLQLSLKKGLDPAQHLALGRALRPLRDEGVLIVGSGMSYHNLRGLSPAFGPASDAFDQWLTGVLAQPDEALREEGLAHWRDAPQARTAHPREEHLLPLMVVAGSGDRPARKVYQDRVLGVTVSAFQFD